MMRHFDPPHHLKTVTLVGLGGTGSALARLLARIIYDMKRARLHLPQVRFIDPDKVELKNCGRQTFCVADVGYNKAEILARRFNLGLGLDISWIAQPVDADKHFQESGNLVVGAVDNHIARSELAKVNGLWLDCGNHFSSGQVILGNTDDWQVQDHLPYPAQQTEGWNARAKLLTQTAASLAFNDLHPKGGYLWGSGIPAVAGERITKQTINDLVNYLFPQWNPNQGLIAAANQKTAVTHERTEILSKAPSVINHYDKFVKLSDEIQTYIQKNSLKPKYDSKKVASGMNYLRLLASDLESADPNGFPAFYEKYYASKYATLGRL